MKGGWGKRDSESERKKNRNRRNESPVDSLIAYNSMCCCLLLGLCYGSAVSRGCCHNEASLAAERAREREIERKSWQACESEVAYENR